MGVRVSKIPLCLEYKALEKCYSTLVSNLQQSPSDIVVKLRPSGILANKDLAFLNNQYKDNDEKAIRIMNVMMNQVKNDPRVYSVFIKALKDAGGWTKAAITELEQTYTSLTSGATSCIPSLHQEISSTQPERRAVREDSQEIDQHRCSSPTHDTHASVRATLWEVPTLEELCALPVEKVWYQLGLWLGVEELELQEIYESDTRCQLEDTDLQTDDDDYEYYDEIVDKQLLLRLRARKMFSIFLRSFNTFEYKRFEENIPEENKELLAKYFQKNDHTCAQNCEIIIDKIADPKIQATGKELLDSKPSKHRLVNALVKVGLRREAEKMCISKGTVYYYHTELAY